jgi:hypothetical protein
MKTTALAISFYLAALVFSFYSYAISAASTAVASTNLIIIALSIYGLLSKEHCPFSMRRVFYLFNLFFFGLVPNIDQLTGKIYWGGGNIGWVAFLYTNLLIISSIIVFESGYRLKIWTQLRNEKKKTPIKTESPIALVVLSIAASYLFLEIYDFQLIHLFFRQVEIFDESSVEINQTVWLIANNYLRPMPFLILLLLVGDKKINESFLAFKMPIFLIACFLAFFICFPTGLPRFLTAALYLALLLASTKIFYKSNRLVIVILTSLIFVMPLLDMFRVLKSENIFEYHVLSSISEGNFDAYQNFSRAVEVGFTFEIKQIIGSLLFFVPRSVWIDKPIGSGAALAEQASYSWTNISMPLVGEAFVSLNLLGVLIIFYAIGIVARHIDVRFWSRHGNSDDQMFRTWYRLSVGLFFFLMRGDLMSSFAYFVGISAALATIIYISRFISAIISPIKKMIVCRAK